MATVTVTQAQDTYLHQKKPTTNFGNATVLNVDGNDRGGAVQALLKFDNLFGNGPGQLPFGSKIEHAELVIQTTGSGNGASLHRMLSGWTEDSTWNSLVNGVTAGEYVATADLVTGNVSGGKRPFDVTKSLQAWANGETDQGWLFSPSGHNGWDFYSSEGKINPVLNVTFTPDTGEPTPDPDPETPPPPAGTPFTGTVTSQDETPRVHTDADDADDPALWINRADTSQSLILGTNKDPSGDGGLYVYDLNGDQLQFFTEGDGLNNVDVRYDFQLGGRTVDLIGASNVNEDSLDFFTVDPATRQLSKIGSFEVGIDAYGFALGGDAQGRVYAFVSENDSGTIKQYVLDGSSGTVQGTLVRTISMGSQVEGIVVDDTSGTVYMSEEDVALWKLSLDPATGNTKTMVDKVGSDGHIRAADLEGLTIYHAADGNGYLIASSQRSSEYTVYNQHGDNAYLGTFKIGAGNGIDEVGQTDGLDVMSTGLGSLYPNGLMVVHDGSDDGTSRSNYKFVDWADVAQLGNLKVTPNVAIWDIL